MTVETNQAPAGTPAAAQLQNGDGTPQPPTNDPTPRVSPFDPSKAPRVTDLPPETLAERLSKAKEQAARDARQALMQELGIEDPAAFKKLREETATKLKSFEEQEEKRKRESMSREEQLAADLAREKTEREKYEARVRELEEEQMDAQQTQIVQRIALKHFRSSPRVIKAVIQELREQLFDLERNEPGRLATLTERDVDRMCRRLAAEEPEWAKPDEPTGAPAQAAGASSAATPATPQARPARPVIRRPVTNGAPPPRQSAPVTQPKTDPTAVNGKTFRPNQPNSMSKQEVSRELKKQGINYWG